MQSDACSCGKILNLSKRKKISCFVCQAVRPPSLNLGVSERGSKALLVYWLTLSILKCLTKSMMKITKIFGRVRRYT